MATEIIRWDSIPVYGGAFQGGNEWTCNDWRTWHGKLKSRLGKEAADTIWMYAFTKRNFVSYLDDCMTFDEDFRKFLDREKLADAAGNLITSIANGIWDVISGAGELVGGLASGAGALGRALPIIIPIVLIGGTVLLVSSAVGKVKGGR